MKLVSRKKTKTYLFIIIPILSLILTIGVKYYSKNYKPNIVLIIIDTLRADHLGCYGYERDTSPNIDKLARNGVMFTQAISQAGFTLPSIASILTGKYVGPREFPNPNKNYSLKEQIITLPEILKEYGYKTAAFTGGGYLSSIYGFNQGFDIYEDSKDWIGLEGLLPLVYKWLEQNKNEKFFSFLHTYDVHAPFDPPEPFKNMYVSNYQGQFKDIFLDYRLFRKINGLEKQENLIKLTKDDIDYIVAQYDGGIRYVDTLVGNLIDKLGKLGLSDNTLIVLTADHGQDLMEHGHIWHRDVYDEGIRVPLIFSYPDYLPKGKTIDAQVRSIDLLPTILDILGIRRRRSMDGISLMPLVRAERNKHISYAYSIGTNIDSPRASIRTEDWKLIFTVKNDRYELYNLNKEPDELNNLLGEEEAQFKLLKVKLNDWMNEVPIMFEKTGLILYEDTKERLESLGYIN